MDMKRDYYEDIELFQSNTVFFWTVVLMACLFTLPLYVESYNIYLVNIILVHVIMAVGLNILVGYTGQISLGHAGFFAIGAYGTALISMHLHMPFVVSLIASGLIAAFFGFILGLPALRLEGPYLAIATLGFGLTIMHVIGRWEVFGGRMGITVPPLDMGVPGTPLSFVIEGDVKIYYLILVITILMVICARNLMKTRLGRAFVAIRDDDVAAEVMGVNLTVYKTLSFAVSAFYAGIAGGLYGYVVSFFDPFTFNLILSIIFLVMVVVGGLGSILGSVLGASLITYLQFDLLKNVEELPYLGDLLVLVSRKWLTVIGLANFSSIALGVIMICIVIFEPLGMFGIWIRIKKYWKTWPF
ncbi:MAG TPA: branched-chain amino acid ABC transporter permease [Deltaproteobacteria bacterium]|nr:branched-chain amino acid ABC transporter permease [Deltaproteobacteria bacterium]HOM29272.1 branched-chain amino acid ABC transporter permease [Deltaproteobacteria bacterium]HPP81272.1 branched-chain amino acid ABC transporter permease [Deltaproteobacteria bacterium]